MCPVSVFHPHTPTILFIFLFGGPSNKTRTSFSVQCIQKSKIRQKWSVYIDVYDENDENSFVSYENNPYRALCYMFSSCDADRETITGGICVPVWPVNAFSSVCIAHLLTAIWGSYTPRAWHVNKRHPSTNTIKEYTVFQMDILLVLLLCDCFWLIHLGSTLEYVPASPNCSWCECVVSRVYPLPLQSPVSFSDFHTLQRHKLPQLLHPPTNT